MPGQTYAVLAAKTHVLRFHAWTKMRTVDRLATAVATPCLAEVAICPRVAVAGANPINVVVREFALKSQIACPERPRRSKAKSSIQPGKTLCITCSCTFPITRWIRAFNRSHQALRVTYVVPRLLETRSSRRIRPPMGPSPCKAFRLERNYRSSFKSAAGDGNSRLT